MLLAIDIGNTNLTFGLFQGEEGGDDGMRSLRGIAEDLPQARI